MSKILLKNVVWKEGKYYVSWNLNTGISSFGSTKKEALKAQLHDTEKQATDAEKRAVEAESKAAEMENRLIEAEKKAEKESKTSLQQKLEIEELKKERDAKEQHIQSLKKIVERNE